ncbi:MAG: HisA/HisF-related TIM barrel protein, partial [Helicobacter sp.]|nr:HisA/HisF-related TIM barrel protein [Helicobacter sp.]
GGWELYTHGGRNPSGIDLEKWAKEVYNLGAGEILLTSMDCDGTKNGYDLEQLKSISNSVGIPLIASGGAGSMEHILDAFKNGADAALAASIFHYQTINILELKRYLKEKGVLVRI